MREKNLLFLRYPSGGRVFGLLATRWRLGASQRCFYCSALSFCGVGYMI